MKFHQILTFWILNILLIPLSHSIDLHQDPTTIDEHPQAQQIDLHPEEIKIPRDGNPDYQYKLGLVIFKKSTTESQFDEAAQWFKKAADQNHAPAKCTLGLIYYKGLGTIQNDQMALELFESSAKDGIKQAHYHLGEMYLIGRVEQKPNIDKAIYHFTKAAYKGHITSHYCLGIIYYAKTAGYQDLELARQWLIYPASKQFPPAQNLLGVIYTQYHGSPERQKLGFEYIEKAALKHYPPAEYNYALMLARGEGVEKNIFHSNFYFGLAASQDHPLAQECLKMMAAGIPLDQMELSPSMNLRIN